MNISGSFLVIPKYCRIAVIRKFSDKGRNPIKLQIAIALQVYMMLAVKSLPNFESIATLNIENLRLFFYGNEKIQNCYLPVRN